MAKRKKFSQQRFLPEWQRLRRPKLSGRNCPSLNGRKFGEDGRALGTAWKAQGNAGGVVRRPRWC